MIPLGQVWPHKGAVGWSRADPSPKALRWPTLGLEGLCAIYDSDAHFVPYYVPGEPEVPRLLKECADDPEVQIRFRVIALDFDPPGHARTEAWTDNFLSVLRAKGWSGYLTRGGGRVLFCSREPLTIQQHAVFRHRAALMVTDAGIPDVDSTCLGEAQWSRCYRLPFVTRDGEPQRLPSVNLLPRGDKIPVLGLDDLPSALGRSDGSGVFAGIEDLPSHWRDRSSVGEGERNMFLAQAAGALRRKGLGGAALLAELAAINERQCDPPLPVREVSDMARKAERQWEAGSGQPPDVEPPDNTEPLDRGDETELAHRILDELPESTVASLGYLWTYGEDTGIWTSRDLETVMSRVTDFAGHPVYSGTDKAGDPIYKPLRVGHNFAKGAASLALIRRRREGFFDSEQPGVAFANGFYSADGELLPHRPEHRARFAFPFDYNPGLEPVAFLHYLRSLWITEEQTRAEVDALISLVRQIIAVFAAGLATRYQRAFILLGNGANGKSVLLDVISALFPEGETVTAVPPQDWGQEYDRATLAGSRVNIVAELPEVEMLAAEKVKGIVSGDLISARHIFGHPFKFRPRAGHLFSANLLPGVRDHSGGFWRRWTVIPFPRTFLGHEQDPGLTARLIETQREAIMSWALAALPAVLARPQGYVIPRCCEALTDDWRGRADQVACFLDEDPAFVRAWAMQASQLYQRYSEWARTNGHKSPLTQRTFSERLASRPGITKARGKNGVTFSGPARVVV